MVPVRWRGPAAAAGAPYGAAVGAATVTAGWHRPSDVIGAFLVTVGWAAAVGAVLVAEWGPGSAAPTRRALRSDRLVVPLLAISAVLLTVVGFAVASTVAALRDRHLEVVSFGAAYAGSVAAIFATGPALVAVLLWCLRDVSLDDPDRRPADGAVSPSPLPNVEAPGRPRRSRAAFAADPNCPHVRPTSAASGHPAASAAAYPPVPCRGMAAEEDEVGGEAAVPPVAPVPHPIEERLERLGELRDEALHAGSPAAVERQHERGKLTARERLERLLDPASFVELDMLARHRAHGFGIENSRPLTDGVVTGWGTIDGRKVFVFAQDFTVFGGALGEVFAEKIHKVMDLAESVGCPMIGLNDGAGARIQEGVVSLAAYGGIFFRNVKASGVIPQISVILGPCAGGAVYSPAMTDFVFMVKGTSHMFITGPDVVKTVTGEDVTQEELGGAMTHASRVRGRETSSPTTGLPEQVRYLFSFLPQNNLEDPRTSGERRPRPAMRGDRRPHPRRAQQAHHDMKKVIAEVVDDGDFFEVHALWAMNIVCGFARIDGHVVGIVGNQPQVLAGTLDIDASEKAARFVRTCDVQHPARDLRRRPRLPSGTDQE